MLDELEHLCDFFLGGHPGRGFLGEPVPLLEILLRPRIGQLDDGPRLLYRLHRFEHVQHDISVHLAFTGMPPDHAEGELHRHRPRDPDLLGDERHVGKGDGHQATLFQTTLSQPHGLVAEGSAGGEQHQVHVHLFQALRHAGRRLPHEGTQPRLVAHEGQVVF